MTKKTLVIWMLAVAAAASGPACDGTDSLDPTCSEAELGTVSFAGDCAVGPKLDAVLGATDAIVGQAEQMATEVKAACDAIVTDLGGQPPAATDDLAADVEASCVAADAAIAEAINAALPVGASLSIQVVEGACAVDVQASANCTAECDVEADIDPGTITCDPGHLYGTCTGTCGGTCQGGCEGGCSAHCTAQCTGTCEGTCNGTCTGTCAVQGAEGQCAGACDGECQGSCSGSCTGSCTGTCEGTCTGSCTGECHGSCTVDYEAPQCDATPPEIEADVDCQASCNAQASVEAECTPPTVTVVATIGGADQARLDALIETLTTNLPALFEAVARTGTDMAEAVVAYADAVVGVADGVADCGVKAVACGVTAVSASARAAGQVQATASVSVNVTVSASASASAQ